MGQREGVKLGDHHLRALQNLRHEGLLSRIALAVRRLGLANERYDGPRSRETTVTAYRKRAALPYGDLESTASRSVNSRLPGSFSRPEQHLSRLPSAFLVVARCSCQEKSHHLTRHPVGGVSFTRSRRVPRLYFRESLGAGRARPSLSPARARWPT